MKSTVSSIAAETKATMLLTATPETVVIILIHRVSAGASRGLAKITQSFHEGRRGSQHPAVLIVRRIVGREGSCDNLQPLANERYNFLNLLQRESLQER